MAKNLVIVESPAKAKTIARFLGADFEVKSSMGHIRGIPSKPGSVDIGKDFTPTFEVDADKKKVVNELKKASQAASAVWLASDEDREGEAIAWHLSQVLKLKPASTKRIAFHEITKSALERALAHPRGIDLPLVEAQQARQTLDYLVGFELSPVLWKKVRSGLSAGRVQSVAARLVVEREREIENHTAESAFKVTAEFKAAGGADLAAELSRKPADAAETEAILQGFAKSGFKVQEASQTPGTRNPSAPFTTSTLQQEASNKLGFSPRATMQLAQKLYESGQITYMRTDSPTLSQEAIGSIGQFIKSEYGENYHQSRNFKARTSGAQEAHEAIRPTSPKRREAGADERQKKLYGLIWRRAVASQMSAAKIEKTTVEILAEANREILQAKGEVILFDGFMKVYGRGREDVVLPPLKAGDSLELVSAAGLETLSRGPARYTEASLVRKLEEMGIGRPSTYASTISTIQARGYVERGDVQGTPRPVQKFTLQNGKLSRAEETIEYGKDSSKLYPTDTGKVVTDFLVKYFGEVVDYDFTKTVEQELDEIAERQTDRVSVLKHFYGPFHKLIEASADVSRASASQARLLGKDPGSGQPIYARFGRYGPMLQKGEQSEENKPAFAPLPAGAKLETVTLDEALEMFKLPRVVGQTAEGEEIKANIGRFGPYVQVGKLFVSIKGQDPLSISEPEARRLIAEKKDKERKKTIADFGQVKVLNGPYGPYVTDGKTNAKIPKDVKPESLDEAASLKLLAEAPKNRRRRPLKTS